MDLDLIRPRRIGPPAPIGGGTWGWSHRDPFIIINGRNVKVDVAAWSNPPAYNFANFDTGPIDISVGIAPGVSGGFYVPNNPDGTPDLGWGAGYHFHFHTDSGLSTGTDSHGDFAETAFVVTVPANLDPDGHEWKMQLQLTADHNPADVVEKLFRSNDPSAEKIIRV